MKAITICNPYPELIMRLEKRVENRTRMWHYRGPILIHAGLSRKFLDLNERGTVDASGIAVAQMQFGMIIGQANIIDCVQPIGLQSEFGEYGKLRPVFSEVVRSKYPWLQEHEHAEGPYCLILDEVKRFETPIPAVGKLGIWEFELPVETKGNTHAGSMDDGSSEGAGTLLV